MTTFGAGFGRRAGLLAALTAAFALPAMASARPHAGHCSHVSLGRVTIRSLYTSLSRYQRTLIWGAAQRRISRRAWRPEAGCLVTLWASAPGQRRFRIVSRARTDGRGRYHFALGLGGGTGRERLFVSVPGARSRVLALFVHYPGSASSGGGGGTGGGSGGNGGGSGSAPPPQHSPSPPPPPPPGAGIAEFNRFAYGDGTSPSDAQKYQFMDLGYGATAPSQASVRSLIASIHAADPGVRILLYKTINVTPSDSQGITGCTAWNSTLPYGGIPLTWFLRGTLGTPLYDSSNNTYWLDPSNSQVQQACLSSAVAMAQKGGFDGVFWDMDSTSRYWAGLSGYSCSSPACASDASWQSAIESFIGATSSGLHSHGLLSIGNISGGSVTGFGGGPALWQAYQQDGLDGAMEETFAAGTTGQPVPLAQWKQELANEAWNEAHGKYLLANADVSNNEVLNTYGLATLLLAGHGFSSWDTASGNVVGGEYWFPEYDTALRLGPPTGPYTALADGLYVRQFQNGTVVVNPTASPISDPVYGSVAAEHALIL